ncbi:MAG: hypothetical protein IIB43_08260 [Candidatus Marinimicrobia bacterium]|nr:hypothetical protein [Candidatus Neomarinimicrobiota bacterium]
MTAAEAQRRRSIDRIVRDYRQRLLSFIRWLAPTRADTEDILQDVLYQFTVSFDDIRSLEDTAAWLFRVARNRVTDLARKPSLGRQLDPAAGVEGYLLEELLPDPSAGRTEAHRLGVGEARAATTRKGCVVATAILSAQGQVLPLKVHPGG